MSQVRKRRSSIGCVFCFLHFSDIVLCNVAVNVGRRRYIVMSHQILRRFQVHALAAEIGAVGVAKIVRRDGRIKGVRDDLVSVDLGTGGAITGAVEACPHPPQAGRGKHSAILPVEEVARFFIQHRGKLVRKRHEAHACGRFGVLERRLIAVRLILN